MGIQYMTDESGKKTAVVIPLEEWEAILERLKEPSAETVAAMEAARRGEVTPTSLDQLAKDWDSPDMVAYDHYNTAKKVLETRYRDTD